MPLDSIILFLCKVTINSVEVSNICVIKATDLHIDPVGLNPFDIAGIALKGTYIVIYSATDSSGNQAVPVTVRLEVSEGTEVHVGNFWLNDEQMIDNATYIYKHYKDAGLSRNVIISILGNMEKKVLSILGYMRDWLLMNYLDMV